MARVEPPYASGHAKAPVYFPPELFAAVKAAAADAGLTVNEWVRCLLIRYLEDVAPHLLEERSAA
jgi:hypothetical protein